MTQKFAKLSEDTRVLLNKARSKLLDKNPKITNTSDDKVINEALKVYIK